jgi:hypothetical protein
MKALCHYGGFLVTLVVILLSSSPSFAFMSSKVSYSAVPSISNHVIKPIYEPLSKLPTFASSFSTTYLNAASAVSKVSALPYSIPTLSALTAAYLNAVSAVSKVSALPYSVPTLSASTAALVAVKEVLMTSRYLQVALASVSFVFASSRIRNKIARGLKKVGNKMEEGWLKRGKGSAFGRTIEVWRFAFSFAFKWLSVNKLKKSKAFLAGNKEEYIQGQKILAKVLKEKILELGPTFIKLGQLVSTRIDVVPKEYIEELKELQDQVPGFSGITLFVHPNNLLLRSACKTIQSHLNTHLPFLLLCR